MPQPVRRLPHVWPSISPDVVSLCPTLLSSLPRTKPKADRPGGAAAARRTWLGFHSRCCADSTLGEHAGPPQRASSLAAGELGLLLASLHVLLRCLLSPCQRQPAVRHPGQQIRASAQRIKLFVIRFSAQRRRR